MGRSPETPKEGTRQQRAAELRREAEQRQRAAASPRPTEQGAEEVATAESAATQNEPVGQGDYVVQQGDCIMTIAHKHGLFWETVWNDPDNAELKQVRKDPRVLMEGDRVTIPEKTRKEDPGETEQRHRFRRRGEPAKLRLQFMKGGEPRANTPYTAEVGGETYEGTTDAEGMVEIVVPSTAKQGTMRVGTGEEETSYKLKLGGLDPHQSVAGVKQRLKNMGFYAGGIDDELGPDLEGAIRTFQELRKLPVTGKPDEATCEELKKAHGS